MMCTHETAPPPPQVTLGGTFDGPGTERANPVGGGVGHNDRVGERPVLPRLNQERLNRSDALRYHAGVDRLVDRDILGDLDLCVVIGVLHRVAGIRAFGERVVRVPDLAQRLLGGRTSVVVEV